MSAISEPFFDPRTSTLTWLVYEPTTRDAVVIDPVFDFEPPERFFTESLERVAARIDALKLKLHFSLETHLHADHVSGGPWLKQPFGAMVAISEHGTSLLGHFTEAKGWALKTDGSQFDVLLRDGEVLAAGALKVTAIPTPGHTPTCLCFLVDDALFTGDALFLDDIGVGRCDFPKGSASALYDSVTARLFSLPDSTRVLPGHDYPPAGRVWQSATTIGQAKQKNVQLNAAMSKDTFVEKRTTRDAGLSKPRLFVPSVELNLQGRKAGRFTHPTGSRARVCCPPRPSRGGRCCPCRRWATKKGRRCRTRCRPSSMPTCTSSPTGCSRRCGGGSKRTPGPFATS